MDWIFNHLFVTRSLLFTLLLPIVQDCQSMYRSLQWFIVREVRCTIGFLDPKVKCLFLALQFKCVFNNLLGTRSSSVFYRPGYEDGLLADRHTVSMKWSPESFHDLAPTLKLLDGHTKKEQLRLLSFVSMFNRCPLRLSSPFHPLRFFRPTEVLLSSHLSPHVWYSVSRDTEGADLDTFLAINKVQKPHF